MDYYVSQICKKQWNHIPHFIWRCNLSISRGLCDIYGRILSRPWWFLIKKACISKSRTYVISSSSVHNYPLSVEDGRIARVLQRWKVLEIRHQMNGVCFSCWSWVLCVLFFASIWGVKCCRARYCRTTQLSNYRAFHAERWLMVDTMIRDKIRISQNPSSHQRDATCVT